VKRNFTLEYWMEDGCYVGRLREVPGGYSQCDSLEELEKAVIKGYRDMMAREGVTPSGEIQSKEIEIDI
jgi:hypothetical protein